MQLARAFPEMDCEQVRFTHQTFTRAAGVLTPDNSESENECSDDETSEDEEVSEDERAIEDDDHEEMPVTRGGVEAEQMGKTKLKSASIYNASMPVVPTSGSSTRFLEDHIGRRGQVHTKRSAPTNLSGSSAKKSRVIPSDVSPVS